MASTCAITWLFEFYSFTWIVNVTIVSLIFPCSFMRLSTLPHVCQPSASFVWLSLCLLMLVHHFSPFSHQFSDFLMKCRISRVFSKYHFVITCVANNTFCTLLMLNFILVNKKILHLMPFGLFFYMVNTFYSVEILFFFAIIKVFY